jgi:phosphoadenosine phosphosulfate reductase
MGLFLDYFVQRSCALLAANEPPEGYYGCFSGGKDSVVIKELARIAGVRVTWHYNITTIDPPELIHFIKRYHSDVQWDRPKKPFFSRMAEKVFPSRKIRWCCTEYKEASPPSGSVLIIGIRIAESRARKQRYTACVMNQQGGQKNKKVFPVRLWGDEDIWEFIRERAIPYCSLYDEGFKRLGCIGCPMTNAKNRLREFERWPKYEILWRRAFHKFWDRKKQKEIDTGIEWQFGKRFSGPDELFEWYKMR